MSERLAPIMLANGLSIRFEDQSNRYYGNFHRVCVRVRICLPEQFPLPDGLTINYLERHLERMGVQGDVVEEVRNALVDNFLNTSRAYFEEETFPPKLLARLQQTKIKPFFLANR